MTKKEAFDKARMIYPLCKRARFAHATSTGDAVLIGGHEEDVCLVVYKRSDLLLLRATIDQALGDKP